MDAILSGFSVAFSATNLAYCTAGVVLGMFVGVLPGIGALAAISMLLPLTFYLDPTTALILLGGVYYGAEYGGSTASILLNLPGSPSNAVTCLDGYPMAQQGRAGVALFITTIGSFVGGSVGIVIMMIATPLVVMMALAFGSAEYFAVIIFGLIAAGTVAQGDPTKGLTMVVLGLALGTVGTDLNTGVIRYDMGFVSLQDGVHIIVLAMGLFGITEVMASVGKASNEGLKEKITLRSMIPTKEDMKRSTMPMLRGAGIGSLLGPLPGTGPSLASFMAYVLEKRVAKDPSRFGKGAIEGIASPETANNAAVQTAFVPTLAMGIPGTVTTAIMLGALMIHGIQPGPRLISEMPDLFWGVVASFWIGNLLLLILNIPLIGIWVSLLKIPYRFLYPAIICLVCIGVYSVHNNVFDLWLLIFFGFLGYIMRLLDYEPAPLLIGFILGPLLEENLRRALLLFRGDYAMFFQRPISGTLLALAIGLILYLIWSRYRLKRQAALAARS